MKVYSQVREPNLDKEWSYIMTTMKEIGATAFKAQCLDLLDEVLRTGEKLLVTKHGRPTALICPPDARKDLPWKPGACAGTVTIADELISPVMEEEAIDLESKWFSIPTSGSGG